MNLGANMNTPERIEMAMAARSIQQLAEIRVCKSFEAEAALYHETPEDLRTRWGEDFKREWNNRYRAARRRLTGLKRRTI